MRRGGRRARRGGAGRGGGPPVGGRGARAQAAGRQRRGGGLRAAGQAGGRGAGRAGRGRPGGRGHRSGPAAQKKDLARLEQLRRELLDAEGKATEAEEPDELPLEAGGSREDLADRCTAARNAEMEARLEVRTAEERLRAIDGRADSLAAAAASERQARARQAERRQQRAAQAAVAGAVALGARYAADAAERSVAQALGMRTEAEAVSAGGAGELKTVRARSRELAADLDTVVSTAHGTEIARAEHRLRLEAARRARPG